MFDVNAWLNQPITVREQYEPDRTMPRHERICWLLMANSGFDIYGWGSYSNRGPGGHRQGLEQDQALELLQYKAFFDGVAACGVDLGAALDPYWSAYKVACNTPAMA